jgi:streptomycin 6-kinase
MSRLWRPLPEQHPFPSLTEWTCLIEPDTLNTLCDGEPPPMDKYVVGAAQLLRMNLLASTTETVLLHSDLHHHNILMATREPWLAIDPKGVAGDAAYEPSSFLYNPTHDWLATLDGPRTVRRRIDIFAERAGLDRQRVIGWAVVQGILSSAWGYEDGGTGWPLSEQVAAWALALL